jgi:hypothetical protein
MSNPAKNRSFLPDYGIRNTLRKEEIEEKANVLLDKARESLRIAGFSEKELKAFSELAYAKQASLVKSAELGQIKSTHLRLLKLLFKKAFVKELNRAAQKLLKLIPKRLLQEAEKLKEQDWNSHEKELDGQKGALAKLAFTIWTLGLSQEDVNASLNIIHEWLQDPEVGSLDKISKIAQI